MDTLNTLSYLLISSTFIFIFFIAWRSGRLGRMFQEGKKVPQRWDAFALLMLLVVAIVYLLIKL